MKRTLVCLLTAILLLSLCACGGGGASADPNAGKYIGYQADVMGWEPIENIYDEGENYIELKSGGKGTFCLNGEVLKVKWTMDGENLTMTADDQTCTGTLKDGLITIDFFGSGIMMSFTKEGAAVSTAPDKGGTDGAKPAASDATFDYDNAGEILFSYPSAQFTVDDYWGALESGEDGYPRITFAADTNDEEKQASLDSIDTYSTVEGFSKSELKVAGNNAYRFTYEDEFGDYCTDTFIVFNTNTASYCGIWVRVTSEVSFEDSQSAVIEGIIQSMTLK